MNKQLLTIGVLLLSLTGLCAAQTAEPEAPAPEAEAGAPPTGWLTCLPFENTNDKLTGSVDYTYMSKLLDKGGEYYGEKSASVSSLNLDLFNTGFGVCVAQRMPNSSGNVRRERLDYAVHYTNTLLPGRRVQTDFRIAWVYHHNYRQSRDNGNTQEYEIGLAWSKLLPCGVTPYYVADYETPSNGGQGNRAAAGWYHLFGLRYDIDVPVGGLLPKQETLPLRVDWSIAYRDGLGGGAVDHDWTHSTIGLSTEIKITEYISVNPGLYYQVSMDDSVNDKDQVYGAITARLRF